MLLDLQVASITLDELAAIMLPTRLIAAIDDTDVEYIVWERRHIMNADPQHAALSAISSANERTLPVVVLGNMVIMPRIQLQSLNIVRSGRSYRAIQSALAGEGEVLVVFVPEAEIPPYRSDEPQQLPAVGVIARLVQAEIQPDDMLLIGLDASTRAIVTARLRHDPFYRATCVPISDPEDVSPESPALMAAVKAQATVIARTLPDLAPELIEDAIRRMNQIEHPGQLADFLTYSPTLAFEDRIASLNTLDPVERLRKVQRALEASRS
jgi:ATP-dependent Lon protease